MSASPDTGSNNFAALIELQELSERLMTQIESAHREIGETRAILKDAIDRLMPAFTASRSAARLARSVSRATDRCCRCRSPAPVTAW